MFQKACHAILKIVARKSSCHTQRRIEFARSCQLGVAVALPSKKHFIDRGHLGHAGSKPAKRT
jgi:hypothetical protein